MNIWTILGLEPTRDVTAIRRAYAQAARKYHPEEQPEEFQRLHSAYEKALEYARTTPRISGNGGGERYVPPAKSYNHLGNKAGAKKNVSTYSGNGGASSAQGPRIDDRGPRRRPRAQVEIVPLGGRRSSSPEPDWLREESAEGQTELFRRAPSLAAFREIWQDGKKARDKNAWREYFSSPVFLDVQRKEGFTAALLELVEKDVKNGRTVQQRFLQQLAIAYGIRYRSKTPYYLPNAAFPGIEAIRDVLELGGGMESLGHEDDKVWAACWRDYFELIALAKNGGFEDPERSGRWKGIFDRYRREKVTDKPDTTRRDEGDVEYRHPLGLRLLAFFVEKNPLPPDAIQYLYDTLKLENVGSTSYKKQYQPLLNAVLPVLPDQAAVKEENEAMRLLYAAISNFMRVYDHRAIFSSIPVMRSYDPRPTQGQLREARELIASPQFQRLFLTQKFKESSAAKRIMESGTCLPALMAEEYAKHRGEGAMLEWCLSAVRSHEHDPERFYDKPYLYAAARLDQLDLTNREFWYYYLSTAFPAGLSTNREVPLEQILREHCHPSLGWRKVFTGFDEAAQRIVKPQRIHFQVGETTVGVEFHYFYQRFLTGEGDEEEEVQELFPWEELLESTRESDFRFWLALPLAIAGETPAASIRGEIIRRLKALPLDEIIWSDLADCLVNHVTTPKKKNTALLSGKMEDGEELYGYEVRQNRTLEVFQLRGILRRRSMLWERPFPNERLAQEEALKYINGRLKKKKERLCREGVRNHATRDKAAALINLLGEGSYPPGEQEADRQITLSATEDFLGYGRKNHGGFTADFYEAHRQHPYRAGVRFGSRQEDAFLLMLTFEIWPYGSPKAKNCGILKLSTRLGLVGTGCYAIGEIGFGEETFTLVSSDARRELYAMRDGTEKMYSGKSLAELVEKMLFPSEWLAVEWVEQYTNG